MNTAPKCRICGCTQLNACVTDGRPCAWVSPDLCSACCEAAMQAIFDEREHTTNAFGDVLAERWRQLEKEGFDEKHDDAHRPSVLTRAALCYAHHAGVTLSLGQSWGPQLADAYAAAKAPEIWPWERERWKPVSPRRDLVRAVALLFAEIEKIDRAAASMETGE